MIKFLKKLFGKKEEIKPVEIEEQVIVEKQPEFVPESPGEVFLVNEGFKYSFGELTKTNNSSSITYNLEKKTMTISKNGGNIVLLTGGNRAKVERFYRKYFI